MKGFLLKRSIDAGIANKLKAIFPADGGYLSKNLQGALPAISLSSQTSLLTAFSNDVAPDMAFAQQVYGYGRKGDVLIGLSTSGNSSNVINALKVAKALDMETVGFTGKDGGAMKDVCDILISVPAVETYRVQEYHLPLYHALCAMVEAEFFGDNR
jgi:D-sedoheptulose 7-phosphate isomerase